VSDTQEALRRLGARLVPCDLCVRLVAVGEHWAVSAYVDGELADWDWMPIACSKECAEELAARHAPWHADAEKAGAVVNYLVLGPEFWKSAPR